MPFTIPEHIIIMWDTTGSSIPSGWSRRTEFNDRYLRGTTGSPNSAGGGGTHTHSGGGGSHTHTYPNHSHDGSVGYSEQHILKNSPTSTWDYGATHFHPYVGASSGGGTSSTSSASTSWNAQTHNPYGRRMIFIQSNGTPEAFPVNSSVFRDSSSIPEGWAQTQQNMFLYGASGDAGGTFGGSHSHSVSGTHNHTSGSHTHSDVTCGDAFPNNEDQIRVYYQSNIRSLLKPPEHSHTISFSTGGSGTSTSSGVGNSGSSTEPSYKKLYCIENHNSEEDYQEDSIVLWLESVSSIPAGWLLCNGSNGTPNMNNYFMKVASSSGEIGSTGGGSSHGHSGGSHGHSDAGTHNHEATADTLSVGSNNAYSGSGGGTKQSHQHRPDDTDSSGVGSYSSPSSNVSTNSTSTTPAYRYACFLKSPLPPGDGNLGVFGSNF